MDAFFLGLSALRNPLQFISSLGLMLLSWGIAITETYVILSQFVPDVQLWWCALGLGIIALGIAIPSAPASIGIWEASSIAAFSLFNVDASSALAYGITTHLLNITINGAFGLIRVGKFRKIHIQLDARSGAAANPGGCSHGAKKCLRIT